MSVQNVTHLIEKGHYSSIFCFCKIVFNLDSEIKDRNGIQTKINTQIDQDLSFVNEKLCVFSCCSKFIFGGHNSSK